MTKENKTEENKIQNMNVQMQDNSEIRNMLILSVVLIIILIAASYFLK